jgi:hypothetical protein
MHDEHGSTDLVHFELPRFVDVGGLVARLGDRCPVAVITEGDIWIVTAVVSGGDELGRVLREVEGYIGEVDLLAIRFCVDGRYYVMNNPPRTRSEAA